jgi:cephalosporin-C deacetylase-like acetyl esterase
MRKHVFAIAFLLAAVEMVGGQPALDQELLDLAAKQQVQRRVRFEAVKTPAELEVLQADLRAKFVSLLDGFPNVHGTPAAKITGIIDADDYVVEKFVFESLPGYWVPAVLYRPKKVDQPLPGILGPCGHSDIGKAHPTYQTLHINLVKRGYVVLSYDPVGQGERSQFWNADKGRSKYNLSCGEHAVLGTPLYLLGTNLAKYRIWDGMRALDYLASRPEVDAKRLGCVGNSGGGTLTAYIAALDPRVKAAVPGCYITTLPRRMANRIEKDPDVDPEQDIFDFVGQGIDHAGLLALRTPRPTMLALAIKDFFPIDGARESFLEAKRLFEVAGAGDALSKTEADMPHGLSAPLRMATYSFFDRWLAEKNRLKQEPESDKVAVRKFQDLWATPDGQVNRTMKSRHLLTLALDEFDHRKMRETKPLAEVLRLDPANAQYRIHSLADGLRGEPLVVLVNDNETRDWQQEREFVAALKDKGFAVVAVDTRGVGTLRPKITMRGNRAYADPLESIEGNLAANAFLVGKSLAAMRVTDVRAALKDLAKAQHKKRVVLVGRKDGAMTATLTAAIDPSVTDVAAEELPLTMRYYFDPVGHPICGASIVPGLLRDFGDIKDVLALIGPRRVLVSAPIGTLADPLPAVRRIEASISTSPNLLSEWLER